MRLMLLVGAIIAFAGGAWYLWRNRIPAATTTGPTNNGVSGADMVLRGARMNGPRPNPRMREKKIEQDYGNTGTFTGTGSSGAALFGSGGVGVVGR